MKLTLTIEANSIKELLDILKLKERELLKGDADGVHEIEKRKVHLGYRDGKDWEQSELDYLVKWYKTKKIKYIALKLMRKPQSISNKLNKMYKEGLPKKQSRSSKATKI
jgi:hypothetical protein